MRPTPRRRPGVSLGEHIRLTVLERIDDETYPPGSRLPTERELADEFQVSLAPVRTALAALATTGHVRRVQGSGTYVSEPPLAIEVALFPSLTEVLTQQKVAWQVSSTWSSLVPTPDVARPWFREVPETAFWLHRVISIHDRPVAALDAWLPADRFGALATHDFSDGSSLYAAMSELCGRRPANRDGVLAVVSAGHDAAESLDLPIGSPVVEVMRSASAPDEPDDVLEVSRVYYEPSVFYFRLKP